MLKVTQIKSGIGRTERTRRTLRGLGLTRMHKTMLLQDTDAVRGMIRAVQHMVKVEKAE
jgi:large subunit ribosomal protein L30